MHRKTTTAALLLTVAVSALSGCVTVQRPSAPGPPGAPSQPSQPSEAHPVVQAPAREALERVGPSRPAKASTPPSHRATPTTATPTTAAPKRKKSPGALDEPARPARPQPRTSGHPQRPTDLPQAPEATRRDGGGGAGVCALGRQYGGWHPDSPEATICEKAYGG